MSVILIQDNTDKHLTEVIEERITVSRGLNLLSILSRLKFNYYHKFRGLDLHFKALQAGSMVQGQWDEIWQGQKPGPPPGSKQCHYSSRFAGRVPGNCLIKKDQRCWSAAAEDELVSPVDQGGHQHPGPDQE